MHCVLWKLHELHTRAHYETLCNDRLIRENTIFTSFLWSSLYKESFNNADIAYRRITTSTVWTLHVDFYLFSLVNTALNVKYI